MNIDKIFEGTEKKMNSSLISLSKEMNGIRTGRASTSLLDGLKVDYYGTSTPLKQIASTSVPDSQMIMVQPWDKSIIANIEKAILESRLGLNPSNDGNSIRIPIPSLTEERRKELVKVVKKASEDSRIAIRNIRRESIESIKKMEKGKEISEDDMHTAQSQIQKLTDTFISKVDAMFSKKEYEVLHE